MAIISTALASGLIGAAGSLGGAGISGAFGRSNARQQFEHAKTLYQNRHQWEVQDLRKAGLNPILSAHGSPPTPSVSQAPTPDFSGVGRDAVSAANSASQRRLMKIQEEATYAQALQAHTAAEKNRSEAQESQMRTSMLGNELAVYERNRDKYESKLLDAPYTREAKGVFSTAKQAATDLIGGSGNVVTDLENARKAAAAANRGDAEVRKRYPNWSPRGPSRQ